MTSPQPFRLAGSQLKSLSVRKDAAGLLRAAGHLSAIGLAMVLVHAAWGTLLVVPGEFVLGYLLAFLFTPLHECAHQTAFRSRLLNYLMGHLSALVILLPYEYYRAFHWEHHRHTQDPERDPELQISHFPRSPAGILWFWSALPFWYGRAKLRLKHALTGRVDVPWVPQDKRKLIVTEARCYLAVYVGVAVLSIAFHTWAACWYWVVPVMLGQLFLRPYLIAEHTGCPHTRNMLENTRTTYTNAVIHFFAWNMPYHAEHHAYPSVPFHALPALNMSMAAHIVHTADGYPQAARQAVKHILAQSPPAGERA